MNVYDKAKAEFVRKWIKVADQLGGGELPDYDHIDYERAEQDLGKFTAEIWYLKWKDLFGALGVFNKKFGLDKLWEDLERLYEIRDRLK